MVRSSRYVTSIDFADTFTHLLLGVTNRVNNGPLELVEAFVTQALTSDGDTCGFTALADYAGATLRFLPTV